MCNLDEFLILNRHLHPDLYDEEILVHIFNSYSDIEDDQGEKNLSFDKFCVVCYDKQLFSNHTQNIYLEINNEYEVDDKYKQLQ